MRIKNQLQSQKGITAKEVTETNNQTKKKRNVHLVVKDKTLILICRIHKGNDFIVQDVENIRTGLVELLFDLGTVDLEVLDAVLAVVRDLLLLD